MANQERGTSLRLSNKPSKLIPRDIGESLGKLPPQARELEEAVLGAVMIDSRAMGELANMLKPEHFYEERHKEIFAAAVQLQEEKIPIDMRTIITQLRKTGKIEIVGGAFYITELTSKVSSAANIKHHALTILEMSLKRQLIQLASQIHHDAYEDTNDVHELFDKISEDLEFIKKNNIPKNNESYIKELWDKLLILEAPEEELPLITIEGTPIVIPGNHTLVVGKKKTRKTLFIVYLIVQYIAVDPANASKILLFDTEQGKSHVYRIRHKVHEMTGLWIPVFYLRGMSPADRKEFIDLTMQYWRTKGKEKATPIKLIVIDGVRDLMVNINDPEESTELIVWLEQLTTKYNVGIIEILHLNKTDNNARGHIGTELLNKALCTIQMDLDDKNDCTIVKCESARDKPFDTFAFTHDSNYLPMIVGVPSGKGVILPTDESRRRLEAVFDGEKLGYKALVENVKIQFEEGETYAKRRITKLTRQGQIRKSGSTHSPVTVYELISTSSIEDYKDQDMTRTAQISLPLNKNLADAPKKEEVMEAVVVDEAPPDDLPF